MFFAIKRPRSFATLSPFWPLNLRRTQEIYSNYYVNINREVHKSVYIMEAMIVPYSSLKEIETLMKMTKLFVVYICQILGYCRKTNVVRSKKRSMEWSLLNQQGIIFETLTLVTIWPIRMVYIISL